MVHATYIYRTLCISNAMQCSRKGLPLQIQLQRRVLLDAALGLRCGGLRMLSTVWYQYGISIVWYGIWYVLYVIWYTVHVILYMVYGIWYSIVV